MFSRAPRCLAAQVAPIFLAIVAQGNFKLNLFSIVFETGPILVISFDLTMQLIKSKISIDSAYPGIINNLLMSCPGLHSNGRI